MGSGRTPDLWRQCGVHSPPFWLCTSSSGMYQRACRGLKSSLTAAARDGRCMFVGAQIGGMSAPLGGRVGAAKSSGRGTVRLKVT